MDGGMNVEAPFFLVGSERSGTTLLRLMLSHHPRIECAPEFEFLVESMPEEGWPDVDRYRAELETSRIFAPHGLQVDPSLDFPDLARSFLEQFAARGGKPIVGATVHKHFDRLLRLWPQARFVHLLRDGRDVARSCIAMGWAGNVWHGAERWIDAELLWSSLRGSLPEERRLDVRYEDLIVAPEETLGQVCRFLGCEYDPAMLSYAESSTYDRPDPALVAQWKRKLSPADLALLEARIGPMLRERGYEESGVAADPPGPLRRLSLALENRSRRAAFRRGRYGLGLVLRGRLARLLRLRGLERRIQLAQNRIDDRHIR